MAEQPRVANDPDRFVSWMLDRLSDIPGTTWSLDPAPAHSSYGDWTVWGSIRTEEGKELGAKKDRSVRSPWIGTSSSPNSPTPSEEGSRRGTEQERPVVARVSNQTLRLERQFQLNKTMLDQFDPAGERHLRALQLVRLGPRTPGEDALTAILMEHPDWNIMRDMINFGPNWYLYNQPPKTHLWSPDYTSSGKFKSGHVQLPEFLDMAIEMCECCAMIHQGNRFVHGELRGDSFAYFRETRGVKLLNYGSGVRTFEHGLTSAGWSALSRENGIEHKLQFVAPEQTGRLQVAPDSRTDIYGLGIIFYNLLTGELPFQGRKPLEILQNVLSRRVPRVSSKRVDVPDVLCDALQKMVQKNIEERYHSVNGLKWDLQQIQKFLAEGDSESLASFKIATKDINSNFLLPPTLVGREKEREKILRVIEKMSDQRKTFSVSQYGTQTPTSPGSRSSSADSRKDSMGPLDGTISEQGNWQTHQSTSLPLSRIVSGAGQDAFSSVADSQNSVQDDDGTIDTATGRHTGSKRTLSEMHMRSSATSNLADGSSMVLRSSQRFKRTGWTEIIALCGAPGLGKSSIVASIQPTARSHGYFCSGKFDQVKQTPFEPVLKVMSSLFRQIFSELDLESPLHLGLRTYLRPVWGLLSAMLGLPESMLTQNDPDHVLHQLERPHFEQPTPSRRTSSPTRGKASLSRSMTPSEILRTGVASKSSRFTAIFIDVLRFISTYQLLLFCLDDISYADEESLDLLQSIVQSKVSMIILLTFRDKTELSPKAQALFSGDYASVTEIELAPLNEDQVAEYVSATLQRTPEYVFPLVAVILNRTSGNPFFVKEMLDSCYRKKCIVYSWKDSVWSYDLDRIFAEFESPNYGSQMSNDFILARLLDLPQSTRTLLAWASQIGSTFSFTLVKTLMLSAAGKEERQEKRPFFPKADLVRQASQDVVRGLQGATSAFVVMPGEDDDHFRFCHDRYQQASAMLPEAKGRLKEMNFAIANALLGTNGMQEGFIFDIAGHICAAIDLIKEQAETQAPFRELLCRAAEKATGTGGRSTALKYLTNALSILQHNPWNEAKPDVNYQETLTLFIRTAECYFYQGFIEPALALINTIFRKARSPADKVPAFILQSRVFVKRGDSASAFRVLKQCLSQLGLHVPDTTWKQCDERFHEVREQLEGQNILERRRDEDHPILDATFIVLCEVMASAFWSDSLLFYQLALVEIDLYLNKGTTPQAGLAYIHLAAVAIGRFDLIHFSCHLGSNAKKLLQEFSDQPYTVGRGLALYCLLVGHFETHVAELLPILDNAVGTSLSAGDDTFALLSVGSAAAHRLWSSQDMVEVENYCAWGPEEIVDWQDDVRGGVLLISVRQFCRALQGKTDTTSPQNLLSDSQHNSNHYISYICDRSSNAERSRATYLTFSLAALCLFGFHEKAIEIGGEVSRTMDLFWSIRFMASNAFYLSLSEMAILREHEQPVESERQVILEVVCQRKERLETWADVNDVNFICWTSTLSAQLMEFEGKYDKCMLAYEAALDHAEIHNFVFDQALTAELYAEFLIRRRANRPARNMFIEAVSRYNAISAFGKAKNVLVKHEWLLQGTTSLNKFDASCQTTDELMDTRPAQSGGLVIRPQSPMRPQSIVGSTNTVRTDDGGLELSALGLDMIDVTGILQSSQVLSSELDVDRLLSKMTKIMLESTGAEISAICSEDDDHGLVVSAASDSSGTEFPVGEKLDGSTPERLVAKTIVTNCLRFKELVAVPNVLLDDRFSNVPSAYSHSKQGRAMLAVPLSHSNQTLGVVYLEGPAYSFSAKNIAVLRLLVIPVSISLTNAQLFKRLEKASAKNAVMVESQKHALAQARDAAEKAKLAEAEAKNMVELKEEAAKAKSMFLANVSHELRTPLNGVIGMSELLKGSTLTTEQESYADSIRVCADTLLTVINDLLDFSKLEAGKMQMFSVPLSLTETIAEVVRALSYSNMMKDLMTIMDLDLDKDLLVMGDPVRLHQILMNLLSNSYKFTTQGSVTVKAVMEEEDDKEITVTCSVADTGLGISDDQKQKLFQPFSQADSSTARTYGGTGLGLSICKAIIENVMKGKVWLESELGKGTKVSFTLKFAKVPKGSALAQETMRAGKADPMAAFSPESENAPLLPSIQGQLDISSVPRDQLRIAIAEDNPINQKIAISFVRKLGYSCEAFGDGRQAVDALAAASAAGSPYIICLMDVQMPVLDGYDATREIRKHPDPVVRDAIIIAMTASAIRGDREKCLEAGMNNYLAKPVRQAVLKQMLDGYLNVPVARGADGNNETDVKRTEILS